MGHPICEPNSSLGKNHLCLKTLAVEVICINKIPSKYENPLASFKSNRHLWIVNEKLTEC